MDELGGNSEGGAPQSEALHTGSVTHALAGLSAGLDAYLDEVQTGGLGRVSDADLLAETRAFEVHRRRLAAADAVLISELERRNLPARFTTRSTSTLLQGLLRLSPSEAASRVTAAHATAPRTTLTGQPLPPLAPALAAAHTTGTVSAEHTRVILTALNTLPTTISTENLASAEQHLSTAAATLRPREVALLGTRIAAHLDPDGTLSTATEQQHRRGFALHPNPDGSYTARGHLPPPAAHYCWPPSPHEPHPNPPPPPATAAVRAPNQTPAATPNACTTPSKTSPAWPYAATNTPPPAPPPRSSSP